MAARRLLLPVAIALLVAGSSALADDGPGLPVERLKWSRVDTPHFRVLSTTSDERTRNVVAALEQFRSFLDRLFPGASRESRRPTQVVIFGSSSQLKPYNLRAGGGVPGDGSGFCASTPFVNYIVIDASPGSLYKSVVYHEYTHFFFDRRYGGFPLWFHEGIAEYLDTFAESETEYRFGHSQPQHLEWVRENRWTPLSWIFSMTADSSDYREVSRNGLFYAESWLLMHYLLHKAGGGGLELSRILELGAGGGPLHQALLDELQLTDVKLDALLGQYAAKKSFQPRTVAIDTKLRSVVREVTPAPLEEALTCLGEIQAFVHQDYGSAERHLRAALERKRDAPGTRSSLAYVLEVRGGDGDELFPSEGDDPWLFIKRGAAGLQRMRNSAELPENSLVQKTRDAFNKAIRLDPELPAAHAGLGETYRFTEGEPTPGIAALERALKLHAETDEPTIALIELYGRVGRLEESDALLGQVTHERRDRDAIRRARAASFRGKQAYAQVLIDKREFDRVVALFDALAQISSNPGDRALMERNAEIFRVESLRFAQIDRYNAAIELINASKLTEARDALMALHAEVTDESLAASVDRALAEVHRRLGGS